MYRIVYWLAIYMVTAHGDEFDCTESKIIVSETFCDHDNTTRFSMQTFNEDLFNAENLTAANFTNDGCPFEFEKPNDFNNTFHIECETEINCFGSKQDIINTYFVECDEINVFDYPTYDVKGTKAISDTFTHNEAGFNDDDSNPNVIGMKRSDDKEANDSKKLIIITSSVAAGVGTVVGLVAALYKLQTLLQSGSYLFPNTPTTTGFTELA